MITLSKVSNSKIVVPKLEKDTRKYKGSDWFPVTYGNYFLCSMTGSGKTTVLINIVNHIKGNDTKIIVICSTVDIDPLWRESIKKWDNVMTFDDIEVVNDFMKEHKEEEEQELEKVIVSKGAMIQTYRKVVNKVLYPKYIFIIDDMGKAMRDNSLEQLMKTSRHYKAAVICSSQHLNDLMPSQIRQLRYVFLFSRFGDKKLEELYNQLDPGISYEEFHKIYKDATKDKYGFLYINRLDNEFRKDFNMKYNIDERDK